MPTLMVSWGTPAKAARVPAPVTEPTTVKLKLLVFKAPKVRVRSPFI